ncbi:carbohydrate ABC transporter permease [Paenibacillus tarimensis]
MLPRIKPAAMGRRFKPEALLRRIKYLILGKELDKGLLFKAFIYLILTTTAYIYINPILYMISTMVKTPKDLLDPTVIWIPSSIFYGHLENALQAIRYSVTAWRSLGLAVSTALLQCVSCAVAGYAFARLQFPFKKFWFGCLLVTLIMPAQVIIIPTIIFISRLKNFAYITDLTQTLGIDISYLMMILPAAFGHGISGALFVIIFRQFFLTQPKELEEAAKIDGASVFRIFTRVLYPLAKPAILVVFLFSFVWVWNDFYYPSMYMSGKDVVYPLATAMRTLSTEINVLIELGEMSEIEAEPVKMAASFLVILPPLLLYTFAQKWFVESVERTGIVE